MLWSVLYLSGGFVMWLVFFLLVIGVVDDFFLFLFPLCLGMLYIQLAFLLCVCVF